MDHAILFSGDADFRRLLESVQRQGVRTTVISSVRTSPPLIGDDLRRQADQFIDLADIASHFTRRQGEARVARQQQAPIRHPADQFSELDHDDED